MRMAPQLSNTQSAKIKLKFRTPTNIKAKKQLSGCKKHTSRSEQLPLSFIFPMISYLAITRRIDKKASLVMSNVRSL